MKNKIVYLIALLFIASSIACFLEEGPREEVVATITGHTFATYMGNGCGGGHIL